MAEQPNRPDHERTPGVRVPPEIRSSAYHGRRFRGIAPDLALPALAEALLRNVWFGTCVYHQPGIDSRLRVVPVDDIVFASAMVGAVRGVDPETGHHFHDTRRCFDAAAHTDANGARIYERNARPVFPRLAR